MHIAVVYGSCYGNAKRYAQALAERLGEAAVPYQKAGDLSACDTIVYIGGLYAGRVRGLSKTAGRLPAGTDKKLVIVTVGLSDPQNPDNAAAIRDAVKQQLPQQLFDSAVLYHLRGGIAYRRLKPVHRLMMWLFYRMVRRTPREQMSADACGIVDTYGREVDFVDISGLDTIYKAIIQSS